MQAKDNRLLGRQQTVRLLLETFVIVFSVLFALAVNGCREKAQMRQTVDRIYETLRREVTQNQEAEPARDSELVSRHRVEDHRSALLGET